MGGFAEFGRGVLQGVSIRFHGASGVSRVFKEFHGIPGSFLEHSWVSEVFREFQPIFGSTNDIHEGFWGVQRFLGGI